jgi:hypothetical protein
MIISLCKQGIGKVPQSSPYDTVYLDPVKFQKLHFSQIQELGFVERPMGGANGQAHVDATRIQKRFDWIWHLA